MTSSQVSAIHAGHIARISLVRGASGAVDLDGFASIAKAVRAATEDPEVRVLIIDTEADALDCAELGEPAVVERVGPEGLARLGQFFDSLDGGIISVPIAKDKPVIAALRGRASGIGADLLLACDIRIMSEESSVAFDHLAQGQLPGASATLLPRVVGLGRAFEMLLGGDPVNAEVAGRVRLADVVVPADRVEETAQALAERVAKGPPVAMRLTKRIIYRGLTSTPEAAYAYTVMARTVLFYLTGETREGFDSFVEKRLPRF